MSTSIAIVGAGFSGTVIAANLLRRPPPDITEIILIERAATAVGRGVAYAAHDFPYLLNVPAGRLSADSRDAMQFLHFAQRTAPGVGPEDFLPRQLYGDYLQDFLRQAEIEAAGRVRLSRLCAEVTGVAAGGGEGPLTLSFADHAPLLARQVILAVGNPPPRVQPWAEALREHPAYRHNPWDLPSHLGAEHRVLIVGNGLTMVDVVLFLARDAEATPQLTTLSRRGLIPLPQSAFHASAIQASAAFFDEATSIRQILAASRALTREIEHHGGDWREVVTFIRNLAPSLWQRLPDAERRRFLRHLQGHWDVHRHRLPERLAARVEELRRCGTLDINAGRIERVTSEGDRLRVTWRPRGAADAQTLAVDALVNATGPDYAVKRSRNPLLRALLRDGSVSQDALDLGLRTARHGACVAADGRVSDRLYYLGPMLRAGHWEATAAAELRNHAEALARHLAEER